MQQFSHDNCLKCFSPLNGQLVCPECGYNQNSYRLPEGALPPFTVLHNKYWLGAVLGRGGFGITYAALKVERDGHCRRCAIKEYSPSEYSSRQKNTKNIIPHNDAKSRVVFSSGREKFIMEARMLQKFADNPIVVDIQSYFEENNTAYIAMEFLDGEDMQQKTKAPPGSPLRQLRWQFAWDIFQLVGSSLMEIHAQNILHRDIKPGNIFYTKSGDTKLLDFGAARDYIRAEKMNNGLSVLISPGYAPPEQYERNSEQGPWGDVYALCATFYRMVSGKVPTEALVRMKGGKLPTLYELGAVVPKEISDVIQKGMALQVGERYKNFRELFADPRLQQGIGTAERGRELEQEKKQDREPKPKLKPTLKPKPTPTPKPKPTPTPTPKPTPTPESAPVPAPAPAPTSAVPIKPSAHSQGAVLILGGYGTGKSLNVPYGKEITVGRDGQVCQLEIGADDIRVSRIHCKIRYNGQYFYVTDMSSNGTFYENGMRLAKNKACMVKSGTSLYLVSKKNMIRLESK